MKGFAFFRSRSSSGGFLGFLHQVAISAHCLLMTKPEVADPSRLKTYLLRLVGVRVLILSMILGSQAWEILGSTHSTNNTNQIWTLVGLVYAFSLLNVIALTHSRRLITVGYGQLAADVLLASVIIYSTQAHAAVWLYLIAIVGAATVFSMHGAVITAAFSALCYSVLLSYLLTPDGAARSSITVQDILSVYLSLVVIALVAGYLAKQLEVMGSIAERQAKDLNNLTEQQKQLFNDISDGILTIDLDNNISSINQAARAMFGLAEHDAESYIQRPFEDLLKRFHVEDTEALIETLDITSRPRELTLSDKSGREDIHLRYTIRALTDAEELIIGKIIILSDISHVRRIEEQLSLHERMAKLLADSDHSIEAEGSVYDRIIVGDSQMMKRVLALVERVSQSDAAVLITGESGTGKELIARAIHRRSPRRNGKFVAINCGAIPENLIESELFGHKKGAFTGAISDSLGLFRQAHGGTIFLDEIGELPVHLQTKLLRVLQDKKVRAVGDTRDVDVDVRILAATNKLLKDEIAAGRFREDLYYRLNVVNIMLPPLRDRKEDIPLLVRHFIGKNCGPDAVLPKVSPEALQILSNYPFPGNIRELENIVERALVLGGSAILPEHLPDDLMKKPNGEVRHSSSGNISHKTTEIVQLPIDLERELATLERELLNRALEESHGVKKIAADLLGLNFRSLRYRLKKYEMGDDSGAED